MDSSASITFCLLALVMIVQVIPAADCSVRGDAVGEDNFELWIKEPSYGGSQLEDIDDYSYSGDGPIVDDVPPPLKGDRMSRMMPFSPRLGRETVRSSFFSPRLGRSRMPFSPRLGRSTR
ncbi:hypothetical protein AAG570_011542 [Ranatra chinensis]|uniref:Secreted protein n=1 Tax=Ranatra chinensis TaxID=642074 RepID=A0ABD0YL93_9HEMI